MRILVLNGPNLNLLGQREPGIYGACTLAGLEDLCRAEAKTLGVALGFAQSNHEGALVDALHDAQASQDGVVLNAAAYTHSSIALRDAISAISVPVLELHLSNIHAREPFRHRSMIAPVCIGVIAGLGAQGYPLAVRAMHDHIKAPAP